MPGVEPDGGEAASNPIYAGGGAVFFRELADRAGRVLLDTGEPAPGDDAVVAAVWDLVWAGLLTNDTLAPLRARLGGGRGGSGGAHRTRRPAPRGRYAQLRAGRPAMPSRSGPASVGGRWAVAPDREPDPTRRAHARAEAFLERHGVLTRGALSTERVAGGFAGVYRVLRAMEDSGRCRRGYIVEGLGAAQFAVPGAIDRVRAMSRPDGGTPAPEVSGVVLAAADPAQPYGAALPWPETAGDTGHRPARKAGALVVLVDGAPVLYVERGGRSLLSFVAERDALRAGAEALAAAVHEGWLGTLAVERADGADSLGSDAGRGADGGGVPGHAQGPAAAGVNGHGAAAPRRAGRRGGSWQPGAARRTVAAGRGRGGAGRS